ncbi:hypothetical protein [Moraxella lacunata]
MSSIMSLGGFVGVDCDLSYQRIYLSVAFHPIHPTNLISTMGL